jgi:VanZ family protein
MALNRQIIGLWGPVALWMSVIYALSARSTLLEMDNRILEFLVHSAAHVTEYVVLGFLLARALRVENTRQRLAIGFLVAMLYALSDEWHQSFVPGRDASLLDLTMDALGILIGGTIWMRRHKDVVGDPLDLQERRS